ncbi:hypothetical protein GGD89_001114 [Roseospira visakhapatnamensis]|uniref:Type II toxin-antitoxin system HicA family toxin n=1 Tax=Roseospira visakhapatnamensis TaxID=390880 RepID=A0A7W6RBJ3_9PROT|nr:hypothetical protein [Roseospira visakhapatnamensis]
MPTRDQFLRALRRECRKAGYVLLLDTKKGKGSHIEVSVGSRSTYVKDGELSPDYMRLVRKQLGFKR